MKSLVQGAIVVLAVLGASCGGSTPHAARGTTTTLPPGRSQLSAQADLNAKAACRTYSSAMAPVISAGLAAGNLSRIAELDASTSAATVGGPYGAALHEAGLAAAGNNSYVSFDSAFLSFGDAVTKHDLNAVRSAAEDIRQACSTVGS